MLYERELEFKFRADGIELQDFERLMQTLEVTQFICGASWDIYYVQDRDFDSFQRFRNDPLRPELTKKVKTEQGNNWVRLESDLRLALGTTEKQVAFHVGMDGYKENFRIFKVCQIYFTHTLNYVYYVTLDQHLQPTGRFIEVEVNKDQVGRLEMGQKGGALEALRKGELVLSSIGIKPKDRLNESLFELFRVPPYKLEGIA